MDSIISNQVIQVLDNLCEKFGIVIDWTSENVMPYLMELFSRYRLYLILTTGFEILCPFVMAIVGIIFMRETVKSIPYFLKHEEAESPEDSFRVAVFFVGLILTVVGFLVFFFKVPDFINAVCFSEGYLIRILTNYGK